MNESSFSNNGWLTKSKEKILNLYSSIDREKTGRFMPFLKSLARAETQLASSWIWIRIADFISFDDNRYA